MTVRVERGTEQGQPESMASSHSHQLGRPERDQHGGRDGHGEHRPMEDRGATVASTGQVSPSATAPVTHATTPSSQHENGVVFHPQHIRHVDSYAVTMLRLRLRRRKRVPEQERIGCANRARAAHTPWPKPPVRRHCAECCSTRPASCWNGTAREGLTMRRIAAEAGCLTSVQRQFGAKAGIAEALWREGSDQLSTHPTR